MGQARRLPCDRRTCPSLVPVRELHEGFATSAPADWSGVRQFPSAGRARPSAGQARFRRCRRSEAVRLRVARNEGALRVRSGGGRWPARPAGALLTMLADTMIPEAYEFGGPTTGLMTV